MNIVLDLGNTRLKAGVLIGTRQPRHVRLHAPIATTYEHIHRFEEWLARLPRPPREVWGINVAHDSKKQAVTEALAPYQCTITWLDATAESTDIYNAYEQPLRLGPDRWFGLLGAFEKYPPSPEQALLYCSFGTATTIDLAVSRQKGIHYLQKQAPQMALPLIAKPWVFIGGTIFPGPYLMHKSLTHHTARLGTGLGLFTDFPRETSSAISSGIITAQIGALVQQCLRAQALCPEAPVKIICTGGGWSLVKQALQRCVETWEHYYPHPAPELQFTEHAVLRGLGTLYFSHD